MARDACIANCLFKREIVGWSVKPRMTADIGLHPNARSGSSASAECP